MKLKYVLLRAVLILAGDISKSRLATAAQCEKLESRVVSTFSEFCRTYIQHNSVIA